MCVIVIEISADIDGYSNDWLGHQSPATRHHNVIVHRFDDYFPLLFFRKIFDVKIICSIAFNKNQLNCSRGEWHWSDAYVCIGMQARGRSRNVRLLVEKTLYIFLQIQSGIPMRIEFSHLYLYLLLVRWAWAFMLF